MEERGTWVSCSSRALPHEGWMKGWSAQSVAEKGPRLRTLSAKATKDPGQMGSPAGLPN